MLCSICCCRCLFVLPARYMSLCVLLDKAFVVLWQAARLCSRDDVKTIFPDAGQ